MIIYHHSTFCPNLKFEACFTAVKIHARVKNMDCDIYTVKHTVDNSGLEKVLN